MNFLDFIKTRPAMNTQDKKNTRKHIDLRNIGNKSTANPELIQAYKYIREAEKLINNYMYSINSAEKAKELRTIFNEMDGILPEYWSNLTLLIVADMCPSNDTTL
jgi:hypothetical protein